MTDEKMIDENGSKKTSSSFHDFGHGGDRGPNIPCDSSNNPAAGQWRSSVMSARMIADYKRFVMTDGEGIRCSLYVSGCPFHCLNCFNSSVWNFRNGRPWTPELEESIISDVRNDFVQGMTFLGGEPLLNTDVLLPLATRIRKEFGHDKDIWCWTGYTWEELSRPGESSDKRELLELVDVLVDGRYVDRLHDPLLQFRGSSNQRILDVPESFRRGEPVIWPRLHDQQRFIPEIGLKDRTAEETD